VVVPLFFLLGLGIYNLILRRLINIGASTPARLLALAGLSIFLGNFAMYEWGDHHRIVKAAYRMSVLMIGPFFINIPLLLSFIGSVVSYSSGGGFP